MMKVGRAGLPWLDKTGGALGSSVVNHRHPEEEE
jgi:hypothetical protein